MAITHPMIVSAASASGTAHIPKTRDGIPTGRTYCGRLVAEPRTLKADLDADVACWSCVAAAGLVPTKNPDRGIPLADCAGHDVLVPGLGCWTWAPWPDGSPKWHAANGNDVWSAPTPVHPLDHP
jgi:hypothetical protein